MAELNRLEVNYPKDCRGVFEDLSTLMFCTHLGLKQGVNRRINQEGVESEPVTIDGKTYAYQAKYYKPTTSLSSKKDDFIHSVRTARKMGVTNLLLFVNKDLPDTNTQTGEEPSYIKAINEAAKGSDKESEVILDWWTLSKIQTTMDMPKYHSVRSIFFGSDDGKAAHVRFYEYVCNQFDSNGDSGKELYGDVPLRDFYIEPTINVTNKNGGNLTVRKYIESWLDEDYSDKRHSSIAVICGEPGHGKTLLSQKAMSDFYKGGWLAGKVSNVFCFSLNPVNTDALAHHQFNHYALLSWGDNRRGTKQKIEPDDCKGALVFFDGFDELLEWCVNSELHINLEGFIKRIARFQQETNAHVVITSRSIVVEQNRDAYGFGTKRVPIVRLQPIAKEQQIGWIRAYTNYCQSHSNGSKQESEEPDDYLSKYMQLHSNTSLQSILGIPIIFRMIVVARYLPEGNKSITQIYDELFHITWERHEHVPGRRLPEEDEKKAKSQLSTHALKVYIDNGDTALVNGILESPWVFTFYTKPDKERHRRVGFLHESFYQYFLAHEILSWLKDYAKDSNKKLFRTHLSYLARARLDRTTLSYIKDIYSGTSDKESLHNAFVMAYTVLKQTDGFLRLPPNKEDAKKMETTIQLERANNVFWNVVSICSMCGHQVTTETVNVRALQLYDLSECVLSGAKLSGADLSGAHLRGANLGYANLQGMDLRYADLQGTDLQGADLGYADIRHVYLRGACLGGAFLRHAHLGGADLGGAFLRHAHLGGADLGGANLRRADLGGANLGYADLGGANLRGADLGAVNLRHTDLRCADLRGAYIRHADFWRANLAGARLGKASIDQAQFSDEDFSGAIISEDDSSLSPTGILSFGF